MEKNVEASVPSDMRLSVVISIVLATAVMGRPIRDLDGGNLSIERKSANPETSPDEFEVASIAK